MHKITVYPLGNADTTRINLAGGEKILIDYADMRNPDDPADKRINLPAELRRDLQEAGRNYYDVTAFTHLDSDHICRASKFFYLRHAGKYQSEGRVYIHELWVPAAAILETGAVDEARIIRAEARHCPIEGRGIRVFSSPGLLDDWLRGRGIEPSERKHLITDAGQVVPGFTLEAHGIEFFAHPPFATRSEQGKLIERNRDALALQATQAEGRLTRVHFFSDLTHDVIDDIVRVTEHHAERDRNRYKRLVWDVFHLPHHCSYRSLSPEKGQDKTEPVPRVKRLYETYGQDRAKLISTSDSIPVEDTEQPPHRQAAAYYREVAQQLSGEFLVTMEYPSRHDPQPIVISIGGGRATVKKEIVGGVGPITSRPASRAGGDEYGR